MNYFQAHPRAGGVSEAASERADMWTDLSREH